MMTPDPSPRQASDSNPPAPPAFGELPPSLPLVAPDILCRSCSYALQGIATATACPECGTPVTNSLRGDILEFSSPQYVRGLWLGALLVELSTILSILGILALIPMVALATSRVGGGTISVIRVQRTFDVLSELSGFISAAIGLYGWWLLTQRDQGHALGVKDVAARKTLRALVVARAVRAVLGLIVTFVPVLANSPFSAFTLSINVNPGNLPQTIQNPTWWLAVGLRLGFLVALLVQFFVSLRFLHALASRIPSTRLAKHARRAGWLVPLGCTVGLVPCLIGFPAAIAYCVWIMDLTRRNLRDVLRRQIALASSPPDRLSP